MEQGSWLVGSAATLRDELLKMVNELGVQCLTVFPHLRGLTQHDTLEQLEQFQTEIMPALAEPIDGGCSATAAPRSR